MPEDTETSSSDDGPDRPDGTDATAQVQRAAREVLGAARSFLDAVEELVEDRDRLHGAVESVTGVVSDLVARVSPGRPSPWGDADDEADDGWTAQGWAKDPEGDAEPAPEPAPTKVRKIQVD